MSDAPQVRQWMENTPASPVSGRTNKAIEALLAQEFTVYTHRNVRDAVQWAAGVGEDRTIEQYMERVVKYGPFESDATHIGRWGLDRDHELVEERDYE
ncbi:hypothetical protein [Halomarina rubra]|uniref:Uncharacterized protein n=1 Tax=Halomarina rubra TaxID=2071873 RepID=A0ABD6B234_9EURY|nr:hypothetical protein [Halomarina rubra]